MKVEIINFMCHESLEIDLDHFQIISATNGSGKSAIFHSINWCINGGSNNFIKTGHRNSSVSITIGSDIYKREVVKDKNAVYKNGVEICSTKESLENLGIVIPLEYFSQFDKLYLLNETPKNKADLLNSMFDIEDVEMASTNIKKHIKDEKLQYENLTLRISKDCEYLDKISSKIVELERLEAIYNNTSNVLSELKSIQIEKSKLRKLLENIELNVDMSICDNLNSLKTFRYKIKPTPNKINIDINSNMLYNIKKIVEIKKNIKHIPKSVVQTIDTSKVENLSKIKSIVGQFNINIKTINNLKIEHDELNNKLEGVECPCCKKKM